MEHFYQSIQGFSEDKHQGVLLRHFLNNIAPEGRLRFVEIGVLNGRCSAMWNVMLHNWSIENNRQYEYYAVDHFLGSAEHQKGVDYFQNATNNLRPLLYLPNHFEIIRNDSTQQAQLFPANYFDFVYIDASHDYLSVLDDINAWFPKVKTGGILCGDDYCAGWEGVVRAVDDTFKGKVEIIGESQWFVVK